MSKQIELLEKQANDIIDLCINDIEKIGPNVKILKVIKQEFCEIIDCIKHEGKIRVLNVRKQLLSSKIISDSANFNFNKELFLKITEFSDECTKLPKKCLKVMYDY